jgi:hypothetical protein
LEYGTGKRHGHHTLGARFQQGSGTGVQRRPGGVDVVHQDRHRGCLGAVGEPDRTSRVLDPRRSLEADLRGVRRAHEQIAQRQGRLAGQRTGDGGGLVEAVASPAPGVRRDRNQRACKQCRRRSRCDLARHQPGHRQRGARLQRGYGGTADAVVGKRRPCRFEGELPAAALGTGARRARRGCAAVQAARLGQRQHPRSAWRAQRRAGKLGLAAGDAERRHDKEHQLTGQQAQHRSRSFLR